MTDPSATSLPPAPGLVHQALLYRDEDELAVAVGAFIGDAVAAREPVLLALPGEHLHPFRELSGDLPPLVFQDMRDAGRNPNCLLALMEDWIAARSDSGTGGAGGRVRIVSESIWPGRSYPEAAECLRHEALVNDVLADAPATLLCPYDAAHLDAETLAGAELTHPALLDGGRRRPSLAYPGLAALDLDAIWPLEPSGSPVHEHDPGTGLSQLRRSVAADPLVGALTPDRRSDLVLAVNEAATNAVRHGDGVGSARIWHDGRGLVTEISSDAAGPDQLAGRGRRPDPAADSGRGLWLINQVCDLVEMRSGDAGTTVRLHMHDDVMH
jgi:anti-sigma regulatory factor (Ser/Thr protein kinase)